MAAKSRLRNLIDQLEERYQRMTEEDTFKLDVPQLPHVDLSQVELRLQESHALSETAKDTYDALKREESEIYCYYHGRVNLQQLVSRLPPEILGIIFDLACATNPFWDVDPHRSSINPAWRQNTWKSRELISLTCTRWRQVALQTPSMWSYIQVSSSKRGKPLPQISLIRSSISRARSTPLTISIELSNQFDGWAEVSNIFRAETKRIRSLHLTEPGFGSPLRMRWLDSTPNVCPVLQVLRLKIACATEAAPHLDLSQALNLRFLSIDYSFGDPHSEPRLLTFELPPSTPIEELYLRGEISLLSSMHAISECSETLQIAAVALKPWNWYGRTSPLTPPDSLSLPHLRTFVASVNLLAALRETVIHLPVATTIQIEIDRGHRLSCTFDCPLITCFASRGVPDEMVRQLLRMIPTVREVFFRYVGLDNLKALVNAKKTTVPVAPLLETVWLGSDCVETGSAPDAQAALKRRRRNGVEIRWRNHNEGPPIYPPWFVRFN
ncbi:hypothetical protein DL93DRAFT_2169748 [Clavulina sp. PMI_390]|nr:hypothetical protein DL93DRAFT_2169748 [Clavulina sp. PMI_390]